MKKFCYFGGKIEESGKVGLPLNDIGILRGFAAFDFMRIYNGVPFHLSDHVKRFRKSAETLGLSLEFSEKDFENVLMELLEKNEMRNAHVRFILTGGIAKNGLEPSEPFLYILFEDLVDITDEVFEKGVSIITHEYQRPFAEAKTTNYQETVSLQKEKITKGAAEILFISNGVVLEASTSNICIVKNGVLITPKDDILHGITKKGVLELARQNRIEVQEREVSIEELLDADEVFMTATNKKVLPVVKVDEKVIADGKVGALSKKLLELFENEIIETCGEYR